MAAPARKRASSARVARAPKRLRAVESRAERVIRFIEGHLKVPKGDHVGRPVKLRSWQKDIIRQIYGTPTRQFILSLGRKNAKSALTAMLVLAHLVGPEAKRNAEIYSGAQSREQAAIVFGMAAQMVRMSDALSDPNMVVVRDSAKELFSPLTGVRYKALSADATTAYGFAPSLAIHDELGQVRGPRSELYSALETAMGSVADPLSIVISTQAPTDADLLSTLIDSALSGQDPRRKVVLFTAPPDADPWAEETWRLANPALGDFLSVKEIGHLAKTAKLLPAEEASFRNLNLNQRVATQDHFLAPAVWALNAEPSDLSVLEERPVYVGADLSATRDLTALFAGAQDANGIWHFRQWFFLPRDGLRERAQKDRVPYDLWAEQGYLTLTPGQSVNYDTVAEVVVPVLRRLDVRAVAYDRWQFEQLKQAFARQRWEPPFLQDFGQGYKTMSPALRTFELAALEGRLRHGNNPILRMCAENARVKPDDAGNRKLVKKSEFGRIDGMIAAVMMVAAGSLAPPADAEPRILIWD